MKLWSKILALLLVLVLCAACVAEEAGDAEIEMEVVANEASPSELEVPPEELGGDDLAAMNAAAQKGVPTDLELGVKETYTLNTKGLGKKLTFKSNKAKVAKVSKKGVITGVKKGTAVITVLSGKKEVARCTVKVLAAPSKVSFPQKSIAIGVKETLTVEPTVPKNTRGVFTWSTKNKKIATVDKTGKIKGVKAGSTTVTVTAQNKKKATLTVTVMAAPTSVKLDETSLTLDVGKTGQLKATLSAKTASQITWKSSNSKVATVDGDGLVTAVAPGTAKITANTFNKKKATCTVTVLEPEEPVPALTLEPVGDTWRELQLGETTTMEVRADSATGAVRYQWYRSNYDYSVKDAISGATGASYTPDAADIACRYVCRAQDDAGNAEEVEFSLNIDTGLQVDYVDGQDREAPYGQSATMAVSASNKDGMISYSWCIYDPKTDTITPVAGDGPTLTTGPVTTQSEYLCTVRDRFFGNWTMTFHVRVANGLWISYADYFMYTVPKGQTVTLEVEAGCDQGDLTFQWYRYDDGKETPIPGATGTTYVTDPVTGRVEYHCYATDMYGCSDMQFFEVDVE